jgi:hypothetical protein
MDSDNLWDRFKRTIGLESKGKGEEKKEPAFDKMRLKDYASFGIDSKFFTAGNKVQAGRVPVPKKVGAGDMWSEYLSAVNSLKSRNNKVANDLIKAFSRKA